MHSTTQPTSPACPDVPDCLVDWLYVTFVAAPESGYDVMNPAYYQNKYAHVRGPLTREQLALALRASAQGKRQRGRPTSTGSIAVRLAHPDGWATIAAIDVDHGSSAAVQRVLDVCVQFGLWAFAELSQSDKHDGGHIFIPFAQPQPASFLFDIAQRIQVMAQVTGEAYPTRTQSLRLPLMLHQRAPGGPRRFPIILADGMTIFSEALCDDLRQLSVHWQSNGAEALDRVLQELPPVTSATPAPLHKSQVNSDNSDSIITWYLRHYSLDDLLSTVGAGGDGRVLYCPWHDDKTPSLAVWQHWGGHLVCRCLSRNSNCQAAAQPYLDAFNLYCLQHCLSAGEAVKRIAQEHDLDRKRTVRPVNHTAIDVSPKAVAKHQVMVANARKRLNVVIKQATVSRGKVTLIKAVPGLGKTTGAAQRANQLRREGLKVAIVVGSHEIAEQEWEPLLKSSYIWQPRTVLCTCHDPKKLSALPELGYAQPKCQPVCPYEQQAEFAVNHIVVYQYNHLFLYNGELLADADVVIIDENPLSAMLPERTVTTNDLEELLAYLDKECDPAGTLVRGLLKGVVGQDTLTGGELVARVREAVRGDFDRLLEDARSSPASHIRPRPNVITSIDKLPMQFLGELLKALVHDRDNPNSLLHVVKNSFTWIDRQKLLEQVFEQSNPPAVVVLDGSANEYIAAQLFQPWPVELVAIEVPNAPSVQIVQSVVGPSTRQIVNTKRDTELMLAKVAAACNSLDLRLDGGVTYKATVNAAEQAFGGTWLYYGNQRGKNDLADATTVAIIGSPTVPPAAIARQARALWCDDAEPITIEATRVATGYYVSDDPRLQALMDLKTREELRQAIHRVRPILAAQQLRILVFSPWDLTSLGFTVTTTIEELPNGNSKEHKGALSVYANRR